MINNPDYISAMSADKEKGKSKRAAERATASLKRKEASSSESSGNSAVKSMASNYSSKSGGSDSGGGSAAGDIGGMMMASGEPTTMAAGATLKVISGVRDRQRKEAQAKVEAENARRGRLMQSLANLGSGIGSIGMA